MPENELTPFERELKESVAEVRGHSPADDTAEPTAAPPGRAGLSPTADKDPASGSGSDVDQSRP